MDLKHAPMAAGTRFNTRVGGGAPAAGAAAAAAAAAAPSSSVSAGTRGRTRARAAAAGDASAAASSSKTNSKETEMPVVSPSVPLKGPGAVILKWTDSKTNILCCFLHLMVRLANMSQWKASNRAVEGDHCNGCGAGAPYFAIEEMAKFRDTNGTATTMCMVCIAYTTQTLGNVKGAEMAMAVDRVKKLGKTCMACDSDGIAAFECIVCSGRVHPLCANGWYLAWGDAHGSFAGLCPHCSQHNKSKVPANSDWFLLDLLTKVDNERTDFWQYEHTGESRVQFDENGVVIPIDLNDDADEGMHLCLLCVYKFREQISVRTDVVPVDRNIDVPCRTVHARQAKTTANNKIDAVRAEGFSLQPLPYCVDVLMCYTDVG